MCRVTIQLFAVLVLLVAEGQWNTILAQSQKVTKVAILETVDKEGTISYGAKLMLRSSIASAITKTPGYEGYDRVDISSIMDEHEFQRNGLVNDAEIKKLGEMTGAEYILVAEAASLDSQRYLIVASIINVETARLEKAENEVIDNNSLPEGCNQLVAKLFNGASSTTIQSKKGTDYRAIDLGLSVKWADRNLGASSSTEYGHYYAWGETASKATFTEKNYDPLHDGPGTIDYIGTMDISGTRFDAARAEWGGKWRMPTLSECNELLSLCVWSWNGKGYNITGPNGNRIFLPAAGYIYDSEHRGEGSVLNYWVASWSITYEVGAQVLTYHPDHEVVYSINRYFGLTIRPVID